MQLCPCGVHSPTNPTDPKTRKSTVVSNSLPKRFARFALCGDEPGGRRGAPICRFSGLSRFRDSTSQISRAGVYSINRPLLKKFGRRLPEIFRCRFSTLAFRQIRRAGVSCINRPLLKKFGRHLTDNLTIPNRRPARDVVSNLRIHTQRM